MLSASLAPSAASLYLWVNFVDFSIKIILYCIVVILHGYHFMKLHEEYKHKLIIRLHLNSLKSAADLKYKYKTGKCEWY